MAKELIEKFDFYNPLDASDPIWVIANSAGHHPRTLLGAYAIDKALPSRLQPELLEMYYRLSAIWQSWNRQYYQDYCQDPEPDRIQCQGIRSLHSSPPLPPALLAWLKRLAGPHLFYPDTRKKVCSTGPSSDLNYQDGFVYNAEYRILICLACESMLQPRSASWYQHLNKHHRIKGSACKALLERFATYDLCTTIELSVPQKKIAPIPGLRVQEGFRCNMCPSSLGPSFFTIREARMSDHFSQHQVIPKRAWEAKKATRCSLQSFSLARSIMQYFEVDQEI